jgi:hypothetical protein
MSRFNWDKDKYYAYVSFRAKEGQSAKAKDNLIKFIEEELGIPMDDIKKFADLRFNTDDQYVTIAATPSDYTNFVNMVETQCPPAMWMKGDESEK